MEKESEKESYKIIHTLKSGEVRESMEGYVIPVNERTKIAYMILASYVKNETA